MRLLNTNLITLETIVFCFQRFRANNSHPKRNIIKTELSFVNWVWIENWFRVRVPRGFLVEVVVGICEERSRGLMNVEIR